MGEDTLKEDGRLNKRAMATWRRTPMVEQRRWSRAMLKMPEQIGKMKDTRMRRPGAMTQLRRQSWQSWSLFEGMLSRASRHRRPSGSQIRWISLQDMLWLIPWKQHSHFVTYEQSMRKKNAMYPLIFFAVAVRHIHRCHLTSMINSEVSQFRFFVMRLFPLEFCITLRGYWCKTLAYPTFLECVCFLLADQKKTRN